MKDEKRQTSLQVCRWFLTGLCMALMACPSYAQELSVEASVDQSRLPLDEALTLIISVAGKNLGNVPEPTLPGLNDFLIVGRTSATSSNITLSNGQVSSSQTIQYIYQLQPRQAGQFVIGAASILYNGATYRTTPITIEVVSGSGGQRSPGSGGRSGRPAPAAPPAGVQSYSKDDLFVRVVVDKRQVFAGEQITVTYKLFTRVELANVQYDRLPSFTGFWMEEIFAAKHLDYKQEIVDGKRYSTAVLKQIALFPTVTGEQTIEPLTMICDVPAAVSTGRSLLDNFFNDPFDPFLRTRQVSIRTSTQTVTVIPLPSAGQPPGFTGAVGQFSIQSAVDHPRAEVSQPVTLTVHVSGEGNLKTFGEPSLPDMTAFKFYTSESKEEIVPRNLRIGGKKTWAYVLIPLQPGDRQIDPITFSFFDPSSRSYKTVSTTPITMTVAPGKGGDASSGPLPQKMAVAQMRQDIQYIRPESVDLDDQDAPLYGSAWYILLHLIPMGAVVAAFLYRAHADRLFHDVGYARWRRAYGEARGEIEAGEKCLRANNFLQVFAHISNALYRFIGNKCNQPTAGLTTTQITDLLAVRQIDADTIAKTRQCLDACDMARFAPTQLTSRSTRDVLEMARAVIDTLEQRLVKTV